MKHCVLLLLGTVLSWSLAEAQPTKVVTFTRAPLTDLAPVDAEGLMRRTADEAFVEIKQKYIELQKNFTPHYLKTGLELDCRTGVTGPLDGRTFSGFRIDNQVSESAKPKLVETRISVTHYDCFGKLIFVERMSVTAPSARPMTPEQAVRFIRPLQVTGDEVNRNYQLEGDNGKAIFEVRSERLDTVKTEARLTLVQLAEMDFLKIDQVEITPDIRKLRFRIYSGDFPIGTSNFRINFGVPSILFEQNWDAERLVHEVEGKEVSQLTFDEFAQELAVSLAATYMKGSFKRFISNLPKTAKVSGGVGDSPFLRELQLNYNRVLTKTEETQVRQFFERTISDIKEGRIKVE